MVEPEIVRVLGHDIHIEYVDLSDEDLHGDYDPNTHRIRIDKSLTPTLKRLVIFHELTHVVEDLFAIELTETDVCIISTAFVAMLADNKELGNWAFGFPVKRNSKGVG